MKKNTVTLAIALELVCAADPSARWILTGWASHLEPTKAALHAARSYAKHRVEFGEAVEFARLLTVARCVEFGETIEDAAAMIEAAIEARRAKGLA